jgi:hypothetical protein
MPHFVLCPALNLGGLRCFVVCWVLNLEGLRCVVLCRGMLPFVPGAQVRHFVLCQALKLGKGGKAGRTIVVRFLAGPNPKVIRFTPGGRINLIQVTGIQPAAETLNATSGELPFYESHATASDALTLGATMMSTSQAHKPRPRRLLDGSPPDTRIVVASVTREEYAGSSWRNCRGDSRGNSGCATGFGMKSLSE